MKDNPNSMRVLIISPHFPPTNCADHHRIRLVLPYMAENGWDAEVLAIESAQVASPVDPWLEAGLPSEVPVHRVMAMGLCWSRVPSFGSLGFRALRALQKRGDELLREGRFDLIYFSTTVFITHVLGPRWKKRYGVQFVMDYQDPWVNDYYREHPTVVPPGGRLKFGIMDYLHRKIEPRVLRACSGITSVSPAYPRQLSKRYPLLQIDSDKNVLEKKHPLPALVIPFPGDQRDFDLVRLSEAKQSVFDPTDGKQHWIYVGRGGEDMARAVRSLFSALSKLLERHSEERKTLKLHFVGTSYAAAGTGSKTIEPLASEFGLDDIVSEHADRIAYSETLRCLLDADALIIPGSDDPGYTASKIYPYLLAGRPLMAIFSKTSSVVDLIRDVGGGMVVSFTDNDEADTIGERILTEVFTEGLNIPRIPLDEIAFSPYTASYQAHRLCHFLEKIVTASLNITRVGNA